MTFLAPLWLLGLFPWLAVTAFLLVGRRRRVRIPFVELWKVPIDARRPKRRIGPPPLGLVFAMLAMLAAILAAGQPVLRGRGSSGTVVVIVDRGISMSVRQRYIAAARELAHSLQMPDAAPPAIDLRLVPADRSAHESFTTLRLDEFVSTVQRQPPTAVNTAALLANAIAEARRETTHPILVISDQKLASTDAPIIQVVPDNGIYNIGISKLAARPSPKAQVMVEILNDGVTDRRGILHVTTGDMTTTTKPIDLPTPGTAATYFVDVQSLGPTVEANLDVADDFPADNRAWLARQGSWPRLEPQTGVTGGIDRVARLYAQSRPPTDASTKVLIVSHADRLRGDTPGIIVDASTAATPIAKIEAGVRVADHVVTKDVHWEDLGDAHIATARPSGEWTPVVQQGAQVLVAVREMPARHVWIGFDSPTWQRSADFVVFWAHVFEWVGAGGPVYKAGQVGEASRDVPTNGLRNLEGPIRPIAPDSANPAEWPGLYARADGTLLAVNSPTARSQGTPANEWQRRVKNLSLTASGMNLTTRVLFMSFVLILLAICAWKRSSLTGFSGTFTVASAEKTVDEAGSGTTGQAGDAA